MLCHSVCHFRLASFWSMLLCMRVVDEEDGIFGPLRGEFRTSIGILQVVPSISSLFLELVSYQMTTTDDLPNAEYAICLESLSIDRTSATGLRIEPWYPLQ